MKPKTRLILPILLLVSISGLFLSDVLLARRDPVGANYLAWGEAPTRADKFGNCLRYKAVSWLLPDWGSSTDLDLERLNNTECATDEYVRYMHLAVSDTRYDVRNRLFDKWMSGDIDDHETKDSIVSEIAIKGTGFYINDEPENIVLGKIYSLHRFQCKKYIQPLVDEYGDVPLVRVVPPWGRLNPIMSGGSGYYFNTAKCPHKIMRGTKG